MRAIHNTAFGNPLDTLQLVDAAAPGEPGAGEVLVAMEYAPINGNDMLVITGQFKFDTPLPSVVGNEGVGRVVAIGAGVDNVAVGDLVAPPVYSWTWREQLIIPAAGLFPLPSHVDPRQLAMLAINPVTAVLLMERYVDLQAGDWIVQNMGNRSSSSKPTFPARTNFCDAKISPAIANDFTIDNVFFINSEKEV